MSREVIYTKNAPQAIGPYSQGIRTNGTVYVAGLLPWDPQDPDAPLGDAADQARRVLKSLEGIW